MKVLALIESADHVCFRYRLNALAGDLAQEGLFLEGRPLGKGLARIADLLAARQADIVILQRKLLQAWQLSILRKASKLLVYDVDDALFRRDSFTKKTQHNGSRLNRFRRTVRDADAVLVGNDYLAQFASAYTGVNRVYVVPTCVETNWYTTAAHRRAGKGIRLVWIGQSSTLPSLAAAGAQLAAVGERLPGASLRVICDALPKLAGMRVELHPWSAATEIAQLAASDIGISWLCDDLWSMGKCGLKVLQYMAAGLPVVANSVGIHRQLIQHGETGFLADTPAEWAEAIHRLAGDAELRNRMGAAARQKVENEYNARYWGPRVAKLLRGLATPSAPPYADFPAAYPCPLPATSGQWAES